MENKINIAKILKNCPKGIELYSPLCGKCIFDRLNMGTIICKKQNTQEIAFTSNGYYMLPVFDDCECVLFPSKDQRDWSKFKIPDTYKNGDVVVDDFGAIFLYKQIHPSYEEPYADFYCGLTSKIRSFIIKTAEGQRCGKISSIRMATEEESKKLFDAIRENGYKWNAETKTLEELIKPKLEINNKKIMNILEKANQIVNERSEEKERQYGPFKESMKRAAAFYNLMSPEDQQISALCVYKVLIALKLSREAYAHKEDNLLDAVAYIGAMNNYLEGLKSLEDEIKALEAHNNEGVPSEKREKI